MNAKDIALGVALIACAFFLWHGQTATVSASVGVTAANTVRLANGKVVNWPPQLGQPYPELELTDGNGKIVKLADFKGKIILVEPIGMTCPACNAFAGGEKKGGFKGMEVARGDTIADSFTRYTGGLSLDDDQFVFVGLLLYNLHMQGPTQDDAAAWAEHFGFDQKKNVYILAGGSELIGQASYDMIPGLQLIDHNFVLRSDATGHSPHDDMWRTLFPMVPKILEEKRTGAASIHAVAPIAQAMTIEEAYRAIPHARTKFDASTAAMDRTEGQFLDLFFTLSDHAVAERVIQQRGGADDHYDAILNRLAALSVPEKLRHTHNLVTEAIREQRQYVGKLKVGEQFNSGAPLVQNSHGKLLAAYSELMRLYPVEPQHNKQAFFDHLCALDFI